MIFLSLSDPAIESQLPNGKWKLGLEWIHKNATTASDGIYEIEGESFFAKVLTYETKPRTEAFFESHLEFIDLQMCVYGDELIDIIPSGIAEDHTPDHRGDDLVIHPALAGYSTLKLAGDAAAIFFPGDIHRPQIQINKPSTLKKVVLKIAANLVKASPR